MTIYDIWVKATDGTDVPMKKYDGKVLLVVNTATKCGFTPQYFGLESLYQQFKDRGFEVLDFPCNQFASQAPGSDELLSDFCKLNYGTTFQTFAKVDVNGTRAHPLFTHLKLNAADAQSKPETSGMGRLFAGLRRTVMGEDIKWNFTKFLVDRNGNVVERFGPMTKPEDIASVVARLV